VQLGENASDPNLPVYRRNFERVSKMVKGAKTVTQLELARDAGLHKHAIVRWDRVPQHPGKPVADLADIGLLRLMAKEEATAADLNRQADATLQIALAYGSELRKWVLTEIAQQLNASEKSAPLAVVYALQAEKALSPSDPDSARLPILKTLASALRKSGKIEEARQFQARINQIDDALDREFLKDAIPFKPEVFTGRKSKSTRVVLMELFTGAQCPPCVAADAAFDALLKTYKPEEVVFLQYHLHIPGPDPLTNSDSEQRYAYYGDTGTPMIYLDGKEGPALGGPKTGGQRSYRVARQEIDKELESETTAHLKLSADRRGDTINIAAEVFGLEKGDQQARLRFVIVEEVVRYAGRNGQRLHHHVVRSFPGGVEGMPLEKDASKYAASVRISELARTLDNHLTASNDKRPFLDEERPLDLKTLKVVAFIQDDDNKKVLQTAQVDLEHGK
jgi:hypothetical protein